MSSSNATGTDETALQEKVDLMFLKLVEAGVRDIDDIAVLIEKYLKVGKFVVKERLWQLLDERKLELTPDRNIIPPKAA
jgi:hypothetical protein